MSKITASLALAAALALTAGSAPAHAAANTVKNVVLVHGGFVDGSGWKGVYDILKRDGYNVVIVQNPTTSLADDVAATKGALAQLDGPAILVAHSYGGVVISEAGNDPHVRGLVYITSFAADTGESVASILSHPAPGDTPPPILPPQNGFLFLDKAKFASAFAADVEPAEAQFMADSQVPWGVASLTGTVTTPAWRSKPSYYLVATDDHMIPPSVQRMMAERAHATIATSPGSHAVYVSRPQAVADLIERAARETPAQ